MLKSIGLSWRQPTTWAMAAPLVCAVHCILTPILVLALPTLAPGEGVERAILAGSTLLAVSSLRSSISLHGNKLVALPVIAAILVWVGAELLPLPGAAHHIAIPVGSLLMAGGLFWSARLRHRACCPGAGS